MKHQQCAGQRYARQLRTREREYRAKPEKFTQSTPRDWFAALQEIATSHRVPSSSLLSFLSFFLSHLSPTLPLFLLLLLFSVLTIFSFFFFFFVARFVARVADKQRARPLFFAAPVAAFCIGRVARTAGRLVSSFLLTSVFAPVSRPSDFGSNLALAARAESPSTRDTSGHAMWVGSGVNARIERSQRVINNDV